MTIPTYDNVPTDLAANYERFFVPTIPAPLADVTVGKAQIQPGETVLDVACGTGIVARVVAERVGPEADVIGVDQSPEMLAEAKAISTAAGVRIDWREGDAAKLPVDDGSIDVALCQLGLPFIDDRPGAAAELRRVLKPGGRVVINVPGAIHPVNESFADALARHVNPQVGGFMRVVFSMHDPAETEQLLADAGLANVSATVETHRLSLPAPAEFLWGYVSATPLSLFMADVATEARKALEADLVERWQPFVDEAGRLACDQPIVWATATAR